jgi:pimeloyl-ACP methyl ester carboxylesterase
MKAFSSAPALARALVFLLMSAASFIAQRTEVKSPYPPHGKLVDVGGYRLHLDCAGRGGPTTVLIAGAGDFSFDWSLVQPGAARFGRVCSYDRAGLAWSDLGPVPRTMRQDAYELHTLLERAGVKPPYVLVGHSIGGLIARVYASRYPREVAGMVLVDSTTEDATLNYQGRLVRIRETSKGRPVPDVQTLASSPPAPPTAEDLKQAEFNRQVFGPPKIEPPFDRLPPRARALRLWALSNMKLSAATEDFWAEELQEMHAARAGTPQMLGDIPLVVLVGGRSEEAPPGISTEEWSRLAAEKRRQKTELADLSPDAVVIVAEKSGHHIQLEEPEVVTKAIGQVVNSARRHAKLRR